MTREEFIKALPELAKNYQPSAGVLEHIRHVVLCMIIGPSGAGKTTLINHSGLHYVPSDTTRDPRPGERDGVDMNFRQDYDQILADIKAGRFVQIAPFATGDLYATKYTSYPESGAAIMPVMADVIPIFRQLGFKKTIAAFTVPPNYEEWMRRMSYQSITDEQRAKRLKEARQSFEFALSDKDTHFILNDDVEEAVKQVKDLLDGKVNPEREAQAQRIASTLLSQLSSNL